MQRTTTILFVASALVLFAGTGAILADEDHGEEHGKMTVQGEVLDMACYVAHEAKGPDHAG